MEDDDSWEDEDSDESEDEDEDVSVSSDDDDDDDSNESETVTTPENNIDSNNQLLTTLLEIQDKNKNNKISEELISNNLYTKNMPDPDILVRTGGEKRLSNFLLWQLSYAELFFIEKNWPDFNFLDLKKIVNKFRGIKRRFGGLDE